MSLTWRIGPGAPQMSVDGRFKIRGYFQSFPQQGYELEDTKTGKFYTDKKMDALKAKAEEIVASESNVGI